MKSIVCCLVPLLAAVALTVKAEGQEAHVHGLATLMVAQEDKTLEIRFESPANNLIGFERKAKSSEEIQLVENAAAALKSPMDLFSFMGSDCTAEETLVDISNVLDSEDGHSQNHEDDHHKDDHHKDDHHKDDHHKDDRHKDDHHEDGHHEDEGHDGHSEISANYRFSCNKPKSLNALSIMLFSQFPAIEKINAMWVTDTQQGSIVLNPDKKIISLR